MKNLKDIISERLILSKNKQNSEEHPFDLTFNDFYEVMEAYQQDAERPSFKAVYLWPITKTPKLLNFSYNAYLESFFVEYKGDNMITVQFLGRNKRKTRLYIDSDEELRRTFNEKTIEELYNYFTTFVK
jgi:hypothetical protein